MKPTTSRLSGRLMQAGAVIAALALAVPGRGLAAEAKPARPAREAAPAQPAGPVQPPHAWLFGTWTGGMFPVPSVLSPAACLSQPVVIFTRDVVLRASLTSDVYLQRLIETVRTGAHGAEFRFAQGPAVAAGADALGLAGGAPAGGFGCESPDVLHVERHSDNEIAFPHCADFPYPLVRCPSR